MGKPYVIYGECRHGNTVGFCSSAVSDKAMREFCETPEFVTLVKVYAGQQQRRAGMCAACDADARDAAEAKRPIVQKLRDLALLDDVGGAAAEGQVR